MKPILGALTLALTMAASATLAEEFGTIAGTYGEEERQWFTLSRESGGTIQASATIGEGRMGLSNLHIQGHPRTTFTSRDVLSIDLSVLGAVAPGISPLSLEIIFLPEGMSGPVWSSQDAPTPPTISLETIETAEPGGIGYLTGTFAAELCRRDSMGAETDITTCQTIDGTIDTKLLFE